MKHSHTVLNRAVLRIGKIPAVLATLALLCLTMSMTMAHAEVYSPNEVLLTPEQWQEQSSDGKNVTVKMALSNAEESSIIKGVGGVDGYSLTVLNFWQTGKPSDYLNVQVRQNGSFVARCLVYSQKAASGYETVCGGE